ncbi:MAG: TatD family hydrolase [Bacteriovoracaceae bacterium]|nr:TatD family hydrolase [Bacteriovoracaceae bacterium]
MYIDVHTHKKGSSADIKIINIQVMSGNTDTINGQQHISLGLHPWSIKNNQESKALENLTNQLAMPNVFALGEVGLDRSINTPFETQKKIFAQQLDLANKFSKPVIIHSVRSYSDLLEIKKNYPQQLWIIHDFNGNLQIANQLIACLCTLSFGAKLFQTNSKAYKVFLSIPDDHFLLETDDQAKYDIQNIYQQAAKLKNIPLDVLQQSLKSNFEKIFGAV